MTDQWAVVGPDHTVHYRREVGYMDKPLFEVLEGKPKGYWLRRVKRDPEKRDASKTSQKRKAEEALAFAWMNAIESKKVPE